MMPDHLDLPGPSTKEPKERMKSIKILEERNGKLVDVLLPELLLLLLSVRRLVLSRVLVVRLLLIEISASDLASECERSGDMILDCMYVSMHHYFMSAIERVYQNIISLNLTLTRVP
jgi:hypothetical protein